MAEPEISLSDIGSFVPFPSALFDEQMPQLKDTEWRLLCVIVRQTLGWQSGKGRKKRDWMSQKQLIARTGRNSAALSAALDALVRKNIVECHNAEGEPLVSKPQRRHHRGRVYFSLTSRATVHSNPDGRDQRKRAKTGSTNGLDSQCFCPPRVNVGWMKAGDVAMIVAHKLYASDSASGKPTLDIAEDLELGLP